MRNSDGSAAALLGVTRDITERKRTEQALADRNLQLAMAGKSALVGTFAYDADTEKMQISAGYAAILASPMGPPRSRAGNGSSVCSLTIWCGGMS